MPFRDKLYIASVIVVFACVCGYLGFSIAKEFGVMQATDKDSYSQLEGREYARITEFDWASFPAGGLQTDVECWISDHFPGRDRTLLLNASMQRATISVAAKVLGYEVYPTFYGSEVAVSEPDSSLFAIPGSRTQADELANASRAQALSSLARRFGSKRFLAYVPVHSGSLDDSPVARLMDSPQTNRWFRESLLDKTTGIMVLNSGVGVDEFAQSRFRTDHHWNIDGAYDAYLEIARARGFSSFVAKQERIEFEEPSFYGFNARSGRCLSFSDRIFDYRFDIPEFTVLVDGTMKNNEDLTHMRMYGRGEWNPGILSNRYGEFYHSNFAELTLISSSPETDRTLLLVADSFSNCMERLFTKHYAKVIAYDMRSNALTLEEYLDSHPEVDDVVYLMWDHDFMSGVFDEKIGAKL